MSILGRKVSIKPVSVLAVCMVVGALIPAMSKTPSREITLVARDMAFYLENDAENPNPTIVVRAGETVRVVLRNEERGMRHDFAIPALRSASMEGLDWNERGELTLRVPDQPGTYEYACRPHRLMMRGTLRVVLD
jgi:plastocyanin